MFRSSWKLALVRALAFGAIVTTVAAIEGCVVVTDDPKGTVVFQWSLNGSFDAAGCRARGITEIRVAVTGPTAQTFTQTCPASDGKLAGRFDIPTGTYTATATLYRSGAAATTNATRTVVVTSSGATLDFDFPDSSFF